MRFLHPSMFKLMRFPRFSHNPATSSLFRSRSIANSSGIRLNSSSPISTSSADFPSSSVGFDSSEFPRPDPLFIPSVKVLESDDFLSSTHPDGITSNSGSSSSPSSISNDHSPGQQIPISHPDYWNRITWIQHLTMNNGFVTPDYIATMGREVTLIDIRPIHDIFGPLGHVPGSNWVDANEIIEVCRNQLDREQRVVIIARNDPEGEVITHQIKKELKMPFVATMRGGVTQWKLMGFSTVRDTAILMRKGQIRSQNYKFKNFSLDNTNNGGTKAKTITLPELLEHIGDPLNIHWLKLSAFFVHGRQSCIDGRDGCGVIGVPGGDMGEFILALTVLENSADIRLSYSEVETLLNRRLESVGKFYMHTDVDSLTLLEQSMCQDPRLKHVLLPLMKNPIQHRAWMRTPPEVYRPALLEYMLKPEHIGCGHVRLLLTNSAAYRVRPLLVRHALKAFFTTRWKGQPECEYVCLSGIHEEGAILNVNLESRITSFTRIPLISPFWNGKSVFIYHGQLNAFLRKQAALFFTMQDDLVHLSPGAREMFYSKMETLADQQASLTLNQIAKGLPLYDVTFAQRDGRPVLFSCKQRKTKRDGEEDSGSGQRFDETERDLE